MKYGDPTYIISCNIFLAYSCIKMLWPDIDDFQCFSTCALNQQHPPLLVANNASREHYIVPYRRRCFAQRFLRQGVPTLMCQDVCLEAVWLRPAILGIAPPSSHCDIYVSVALLCVQGGGSCIPCRIMTQSLWMYMTSQCTMAFELFFFFVSIRSAAPGGNWEHESNLCER